MQNYPGSVSKEKICKSVYSLTVNLIKRMILSNLILRKQPQKNKNSNKFLMIDGEAQTYCDSLSILANLCI